MLRLQIEHAYNNCLYLPNGKGAVMQESVLIATLGAEPQVVTLTLDALLAQGEHITRVYVIHTDAAHNPIKSALAKLQQVFTRGTRYPSTLLYMPHLLGSAAGALADITTPLDIETAYQVLYRLLRQQKQAGFKVHLSLAGGRKTMTTFALAAAQVALSVEDCVWHLVSPPELIASRAMHAPTPQAVQLIRVPLLSVGHIQSDDARKAETFLHSLSQAEREIVHLLIQGGLTNAQLAEQLGKSVKTVANQLSSIYSKLRNHYALTETPDRTTLMALIGRYS